MKHIIRLLLAVLLLPYNSFLFAREGADSSTIKKPTAENYIRFDDTRNIGWSKEFEVVEIKSGRDNAIQKAYFYKSKEGKKPLIVSFMKSKHTIKKFSAWVPITNLEAWYHESTIMKSKYAPDILACTGSKDSIDSKSARQRSPLYMKTPVEKLKNAKLFIFAGIYDGIQGSVPITHSINFYNKLLKDLSVRDHTKYVSLQEKLDLLEYRRPLGNLGSIADRKICLKKEYGNVRLTLFEGEHEMLPEFALNELLKD